MWSSTLIDDMGLKILPQKSGEILLEIIMRRYENRSTMMTSNRPIEEWGKLLSDVPAASAILDRLLHHAEIIPINGRSYRLQPNPNAAPTQSAPHSPVPVQIRHKRHLPTGCPPFIRFDLDLVNAPRKPGHCHLRLIGVSPFLARTDQTQITIS